MIPTLNGRIQSRLFLVLIIGGLWTAAIGWLLPRPAGTGIGTLYAAAFETLLYVALVGIAWELLYHGLMFFRWEKDWPIMFAFFEGIPEGVLLWYLVSVQGLPLTGIQVPTSTFIIHFTTTWIVTWLYAVGPIRVLLLRHRFMGGRVV